MARHIDYYLALLSPWSYMGGARLHAIAKAAGASVAVKPIHLGPVLEKTGGQPLPKRPPERRAYRLLELARWSERLGMPIHIQPKHFPADERQAASVVVAAGQAGLDSLTLAVRFGKVVWEDEADIADEAVIAAAVRELGMDADALLAAAAEPAIQDVLKQNTADALAAGVFGVPAYIVDGELFWGQDRLDFVEHALAGMA